MRVLIVLTLAFAAVAADPFTTVPRDGQRIVGGDVTTIQNYPTMASLLYGNGWTYWQSCGGTILNQRSILSAAHCFINYLGVLYPAWTWRVRLGSTYANSGGTVFNVGSIIVHSSYSTPIARDNDIAILRLASNIAYGVGIQPASIAGSNYNLADNQAVWATGWGRTSSGGPSSEQLRHVQVFTINQSTCVARYATDNKVVTASMLCTGILNVGGRDQCQGDSGGPVYHNGVVVGVCSWGNGCADPFFPGVNARVSSYTTWIQANA